MATWLKDLRLALRALGMTLRGEEVQRPFGKLRDWIEQTAILSAETLRQADALGIDEPQRKTFTERIDGRTVSLDVALTTLRYHASTEYPHLVHNANEHGITAIYASNLNDSYAIRRFAESDVLHNSRLRSLLQRLAAHLEAIPPSNTAKN